MGRITFTADVQHEDIISDVEAEDGVESQAAAVRECITRYADLQQRIAELQQQLDDLQQENDRLRNEKRLILEDREEKQELARYVEEELSYREAGLTTRAKWWLFGKNGSA